MTSIKKIKKINSKQRPSKGFSEEEFYSVSVKAIDVIKKNDFMAKVNVKSIYPTMNHVSTSFISDHYHINIEGNSHIEIESCQE